MSFLDKIAEIVKSNYDSFWKDDINWETSCTTGAMRLTQRLKK